MWSKFDAFGEYVFREFVRRSRCKQNGFTVEEVEACDKIVRLEK